MRTRAVFSIGVTRLFLVDDSGYLSLIAKIRGKVSKINETSDGGEYFISIDTGNHLCSLWANEIQQGEEEKQNDSES